MGNNNTSHTFSLQALQQIQKVLGVFLVQSSGGFVQNQQAALLAQCLCDFDQLLLTDTDLVDGGVRIIVEANTLQQRDGVGTG